MTSHNVFVNVCCRKGQVKMMADRIIDMRKLLYKALNDIKCPGNWDHVISQKGMFSYTGLNGEHFGYTLLWKVGLCIR